MSFTMSTTSPNAAGWSNYVLNNLFLGPASGTPNAGSGLVDNKFHFSVSFKEVILFFLKSTNLSGSVLSPTTQVIFGFFLSASGNEFSFTKGILEVLNPLLAR